MVSFSGINNEIYLKSARPLLPPPETLKHDIEDDGKSDDVVMKKQKPNREDEYNADPCPIEVTNEKYHEYCALAKQILSTNYAAVQFAREDLSYITSIKIYSRYPKWGWSLKPLPYQHYGGSTGSKKTQMGITMAFAFPDKPVFYFLLKDPADVHQRIYENFTSSASAFLECLNWIRRLLHQKTLHIGFIAELLKMLPEGNVRSLPEKMTTLQIVPLKGSEVLKVLIELNLYDHRPIFIIDGCRCSDLKKIKLVRYLRCVFPIVGLGLVIIGTDDRVARANFTINVSGGMRKMAKWWCTSIQQSSFHLDYFRALLTDELPDEVATILLYSRPWFLVLAMEYFREHGVSRVNFADTMNKAIKEVFGIVLVSKELSSHHSSLAQMQFLLNVQRAKNDPYEEQHITTDHFGLLYPRNSTKLREDELTKENQKQWKTSSEIPHPSDDLLYLILTGGLEYPGLWDTDGRRVPFCYQLEKVLKFTGQKLQNEIYLDNMLFAIFCVSSHASGFSGTTVKKFLADVLYQCQYHAGFTERIEFDQSNYNYFFASINDLCVPFLCSPNSTWPEFAMNVPDFNLGNLTRSTNDVKVNLEAGPYLAGESRGWTKKLGMKELTKILPKIPKSARLFIILTSGTQSSYFDNDGYKHFKTTKKLRNMSFVKVSVGKNPRFKKIVGLPHVNKSR